MCCVCCFPHKLLPTKPAPMFGFIQVHHADVKMKPIPRSEAFPTVITEDGLWCGVPGLRCLHFLGCAGGGDTLTKKQTVLQALPSDDGRICKIFRTITCSVYRLMYNTSISVLCIQDIFITRQNHELNAGLFCDWNVNSGIILDSKYVAVRLKESKLSLVELFNDKSTLQLYCITFTCNQSRNPYLGKLIIGLHLLNKPKQVTTSEHSL